MNILRFIVLAFSIWYLPGFINLLVGETIGSYSSYFMFILIIAYYFLAEKKKPNFSILLLGFFYFTISGLSYEGEFDPYFYKFLKYVIFIIGISEIVTRCKPNYLLIFYLIGALSIIINAILFSHDYGRYSGFYLNPNLAALVALIGYCFCFLIKPKLLRYTCFGIFIFAGFLTFSRYFFLLWILITLLSVIADVKNFHLLVISFGTGVVLLTIASFLQINTERFNAIEGLFSNQSNQSALVLSQDSRTETWSIYYNQVLDGLFFGNGYTSMSGELGTRVGVHNSILLTLGESGLIPFFLLFFIFLKLLGISFKRLKDDSFPMLLSLVLFSYLFVSHNFYDNYLVLFTLVWIFSYLKHSKIIKDINLNT
jgi:hypothetical protein